MQNSLPNTVSKLYRIWLNYTDEQRFNRVTTGFNTQITHIETIIPNSLIQYDILLTQEELLLLTLSFKNIDVIRVDRDGDNNTVYVLSE